MIFFVSKCYAAKVTLKNPVQADLNAVLALQGISPGQNAHDAAIARLLDVHNSSNCWLLIAANVHNTIHYVQYGFARRVLAQESELAGVAAGRR